VSYQLFAMTPQFAWAGICFCPKISPLSRSRAHPPPICFERIAYSATTGSTPPRVNYSHSCWELIIKTPNVRPCMCAVPTFRYAFARSCCNCPSRTVGALNGTHRVQPKGKRMAFYFPFYPCNARLVKVELQVSAQGDAVKGPDVTVSCCIPAVGLSMITFMTLYFRL
jgi:hypothetical protein